MNSMIKGLLCMTLLIVALPITMGANSPTTQLKSLTKGATTKAVSMIAGGSLLFSATCGLSGCSGGGCTFFGFSLGIPPQSNQTPPYHSDYEHMRNFHHGKRLEEKSGGVTWHGHFTSMYSQHGINKRWGIRDIHLEQYLAHKDNLQVDHYAYTMVLYIDNDGYYNYGLVSGETHRQGRNLPQNMALILFSDWQTRHTGLLSATIDINQILAVAFNHHRVYNAKHNKIAVRADAIVDSLNLTEALSIPDYPSVEEEYFYGSVSYRFSNGWSLVKVNEVLVEGAYVPLDPSWVIVDR